MAADDGAPAVNAGMPRDGLVSTVTYAGDLPCADCAGQRVTLTLFPDLTFRMRTVYLGAGADGGDRPVYYLGRWARAQDDGDRLRLRGGTDEPRMFRYVGSDRIEMLDRQGRPIQSELNYQLLRQPAVDPVAGPMRLRGLYRYMADAASIQECQTGKNFPVLIEAGHLAMERAYLALTGEPAAPVMAVFDAEFVSRAPEPGLPERDHLRIVSFDSFRPGLACGDPVGRSG